MNDEHTLLLGEIKGKLDTLIGSHAEQGEKLDSINGRLHRVESRAATHGAVFGGVASVGIALIIEKLKRGIGI